MDGDDRAGLLDSQPGDALALDEIEAHADSRLRLGGGAGELGVALAGVHVAEIEQPARMGDREVDAAAGRGVSNVQIATPLALAIRAAHHFPVRRHAKRADKRGDGPRDPLIEVQEPVAGGSAGTGGVAKDPCRVLAGQLRPAGGLPERAAAGSDCDPGVTVHDDVLDRDHQRVAALGPLHPHRTRDRIHERRRPVEPGPAGGHGLLVRGLEVAGAGIVRLDFEPLPPPDPQQRLIVPIERVFPSLLPDDPLHPLTPVDGHRLPAPAQ